MELQPSGAGPNGSGIIALITGAVTVRDKSGAGFLPSLTRHSQIDSPNPLHFTQMFHFVADEGGNFYMYVCDFWGLIQRPHLPMSFSLNDMHRLIYG